MIYYIFIETNKKKTLTDDEHGDCSDFSDCLCDSGYYGAYCLTQYGMPINTLLIHIY